MNTLDVILEIIKSLGLPVALLVSLALYHIREIRRRENAWLKERDELASKIDFAHKEITRVYEARITAGEELIRESAEAMRSGAEASRELSRSLDLRKR